MLIPTGKHTRLVLDDSAFSSLADGLEGHMKSAGGTLDDPLMAFRRYASKAYNRGRVQPSVRGGRKELVAVRVEAFHAVCNSHVPDFALRNGLHREYRLQIAVFYFAKRLLRA